MLPRIEENRPIRVYEQIENEVSSLLSLIANVRSRVGSIGTQELQNLQRRIVSARAYLNSTVGLTGLQTFMRQQYGRLDATYDWSAALAATTTPGQNVINWLKTNAAVTTDTDANDNPVPRVIDATALGPLLDALVTSITT